MYRIFLSVSLAVLATILLGTVAPLHALNDSCCPNDGQLNYNNGWQPIFNQEHDILKPFMDQNRELMSKVIVGP
jgi:hypothetical protein